MPQILHCGGYFNQITENFRKKGWTWTLKKVNVNLKEQNVNSKEEFFLILPLLDGVLASNNPYGRVVNFKESQREP